MCIRDRYRRGIPKEPGCLGGGAGEQRPDSKFAKDEANACCQRASATLDYYQRKANKSKSSNMLYNKLIW